MRAKFEYGLTHLLRRQDFPRRYAVTYLLSVQPRRSTIPLTYITCSFG